MNSLTKSIAISCVALAVAGEAPTLPASAAESAVPAEKNPPGDIPDSQVFLTYTSKDGYALKVPEGWARKEGAGTASFVDKLDGVVIAISDARAPVTQQTVVDDYLPKLEANERAVKVVSVTPAKLPAGSAIRIVYQSNSEPNPVTNKQIRLENERFLITHGSKLADLRLYAPLGADNVDQWKLMSESFAWR